MNGINTTRHFILKTRNDGNNKYWDTSFQLRPPFKGNSTGQYKITVNEALFNNTEPLVLKGDYYRFNVFTHTTTDKYKYVWTVTMKRDYYLYKQGSAEWKKVTELLRGKLGGLVDPAIHYDYKYQITTREQYKWVETDAETHKGVWQFQHKYEPSDETFNMDVNIVDEEDKEYLGTNAGIQPIMYYEVSIIQLPTGHNFDSIEMTYSWGFAYLLNNIAAKLNEETDEDKLPYTTKTGAHYFEFCNIRIGGPYEYILDLPTVKVDVMTMNEANQAFNIVGHVTNTANNHNELIQFISSMEGKVNALSNFRVRLLNDNFEPVKIRSPLTILITVSNEED